jgi:tRNA pseudouridine65 synthase
VLYEDPYLVAIHKPPGMLVHRTLLSRDRVAVLQTLRDQLGRRVFPVHRLDRATAGVLLFGLDRETARVLGGQFQSGRVDKRYLAVTRGWLEPSGLIDHPVTDLDSGGTAQAARTRYRCIAHVELPEPVDRYPTSRYSLACVEPLTGRRQQIRKHFKHISHHLIGDTTHGNGRHNRFFRERLGLHRLLLLAYRLDLVHPVSGQALHLQAPLDPDWQRVLALFAIDTARLSDELGDAAGRTRGPLAQ